MAINIKEILTTDSDPIKVDKTNYNFDQIVANGGGPIGIKGQKGELGSVGSTGTKGEKGDIGAKGEIGPSGLDLNNWGRIDYDSRTDTSILKPKKDSDDTEPVSIILGDAGYTTGVSDGIVNPNAWLNIVIPDGSAVYSNFISLLNGATSKVNFSSSTLSGVDTYKITHNIGSSNDINFEINIKNEVLINGTDALNLTSGGVINIDSGNNDTVIGPIDSTSAANLDIRFDDTIFRGDLTVDSTGYIKVPVGTTAQRPAGGIVGMIRYNSERNIGFDSPTIGSLEAFSPHINGNYWKPLGILVDADGDTFISPDYNFNDGTENVLTISVGEITGGGVYGKDFVGSFGETAVDGVVNLNRTFTYNNVIYAKDDILVDNNSGLRVRQNVSTPPVGQVNAQNNGATADKRTLHDYYYRASDLQYTATTYSTNTPFNNGNINANSNVYSYTNDAIKALAFEDGSTSFQLQRNVGIVFDSNTSRMSYIKVGHMVTVWGRLDYFPFAVASDNLESDDINFAGEDSALITISNPTRRAAFAIGRPEDFPYRSALLDQRVVFPISISLKAQDSTVDEKTAAYFGVIEHNMNVFTIIKVNDSTGFISGTKNELTDSHYAKHLNLTDLLMTAITPADVITLEYSFSMPTDINSYDLAPNALSTYTENNG